MIRELAAWLAADPYRPVIVLGVLLILGMLAYGITCEMMKRGGRK